VFTALMSFSSLASRLGSSAYSAVRRISAAVREGPNKRRGGAASKALDCNARSISSLEHFPSAQGPLKKLKKETIAASVVATFDSLSGLLDASSIASIAALIALRSPSRSKTQARQTV